MAYHHGGGRSGGRGRGRGRSSGRGGGRGAKNDRTHFIQINQEILKFGKSKDWRGILKLYEKTMSRGQAYNNVNYATTMSQLGKIHNVDVGSVSVIRFIDDVSNMLEARGLEWMGPQGAANIVHAIAKMGARTDSADRIVEFVATEQNAKLLVETRMPQNVSNVCWSLAKLDRSNVSSALFNEVENHAGWVVVEGKPQDISNIALSCAKLGVQSPNFFAMIDKHANKMAEGTTQAIVNTVWSCATLGVQSPKLFAEIDKYTDKLMMEGNAQDISNTAWSCATLGVQSSKLFAMIDKHAQKIVVEGNAQDISNIAWSCATLGVQSPKLFAAIDKYTDKLMMEGNPQNIANTAWSCATLGVQSPKLFAMIDKHAQKIIVEGKPQEISNIAWSCATLGLQSPKLFAMIDKHAEKLVGEGKPQEISNTAWSCATLGVQSPKLFAMIDKHASKIVAEGKPQAIANTAWSCAKLGVQSPKLFAEIERHASKIMAEGTPQNIANTTWSCAQLGVQSPKLFAEIKKHVNKLVGNGNVQDIANTLWALVVAPGLEGKNKDVLLLLWGDAIKLNPEEFTTEGLCQLAQVHTFSSVLNGLDLPRPSTKLLERVHSACAGSDTTQSSSQKEVAALLTELGLLVEEEVSPSPQLDFLDSLLAIDMTIPKDMVAIEYDGSNHFLRSIETGELTRDENGATQAKRRLLEKLGWKVVKIDYRDWGKAGCDKQMKLSLLRKELLLEKAGVQV